MSCSLDISVIWELALEHLQFDKASILENRFPAHAVLPVLALGLLVIVDVEFLIGLRMGGCLRTL